VLDLDGDPAGTCFQVAPGVLVTAWHVLDEVGATGAGAEVAVDPLGGGGRFAAVVARTDQLRDLAVLTSDAVLPAVAGTLAATDEMRVRAPVTATGHAVLEDRLGGYRFLTAVGQWAGATTRGEAVPLGRVIADRVVPGMSGAPVVCDADGAVAGVVSGRYCSADGWPPSTVWVARTEDLMPLLAGLTDVTVRQVPADGPVELVLEVSADRVRLAGTGVDVAAAHGRVGQGLAEAVNEARRERSRAGLRVRAGTAARPGVAGLLLDRAAQLLGESFLPGPVATALAGALQAAGRTHQPVRLGVLVPAELAGLPWESLPGPDGRPLALHPLVSFYRKADAAPPRTLPGPLRIVVAIASPDDGGGVLDYERELRNVLAAVRAARADAADVRVVPFATLAAIRAELDRGPAHVLHVSGHGAPGLLYLEDEDGTPRPVTAAQFLAGAVPPGRMPPVITLSACYSDAAGSEGGSSFAAQLCASGAAAVIATETSVTDTYATRLLARVYGTLAQENRPDAVAALSRARRLVQDELEASDRPRDKLLSGLGEWAAVTVLAASGSVPVIDQEHEATPAAQPSRPAFAGLAARDEWYFVGRRREQRHWPGELLGDTLAGDTLAGIVVYGIGGTGKTTLAAEVAARVQGRDPGRVLVSLTGALTLEGLLGTLTATVRRELLVRGGTDTAAIRALEAAGRADLPWADRLGILRGHVLDHVPVLVLLDNFEDNLRPADGGWTVRDEVLAGLLAAWAADPGRSRLLFTSRHPFTLAGGAERMLSFRQLGPLSLAETVKLAWSLPALDNLDEDQLEQVWRLAGGHPRSLEYLDALLSHGTARYPDVTARLSAAIDRKLSGADRAQWLAARTGLEAALAETVALAADDVLLDDLLTRLGQVAGAPGVLLGLSVYREPADHRALLFQAGQQDPTAERIPDRRAVYEQIGAILADAGITADESLDLDRVPSDVQVLLAPHVAELNREPAPPYRPRPGLTDQVVACQAASLLTLTGAENDRRYFVHRWTATELARRAAASDPGQLALAHRQAAAYWLWRVQEWPQDKAADVHDLLEARHHLLQAGDTEEAAGVTEGICLQLQTWGAWDQETALIHELISELPADSRRQGTWTGQLGNVAYLRGDYAAAARQYQKAIGILERLGDQAGMATSYHQLGMLAQRQGEYEEAARQYQRSLDIEEQMGDQAGIAATYHQLGNVAYLRGDYAGAGAQYRRSLDIEEGLGDQAGMAASFGQLGMLAHDEENFEEAARQYQRALDTFKRLGDQANMAKSYHQLGMLAQHQGDYGEAARQYERSLDISERLGDQASMASSYHQLGILAQDQGDYGEAARQYERSLDISERLGDQANLASSYSQLGILEQVRGGQIAAAIALHVRALAIRVALGIPQAVIDLRRLSAYRRELGAARFTGLLTSPAGNSGVVDAIMSLLDEFDDSDSTT
jgi:tetratricopeptide (TPR) repeat protein